MPKKGVLLNRQATERIKTWLEQEGISQEKFALEVLEVNPKTLNNWMSGRNSVDLEKFGVIIGTLGIGIEDFFGAEEVPDEFQQKTQLLLPFVRMLMSDKSLERLQKYYRKTLLGLSRHISLTKWPVKGYFKTFRHDTANGKNYYAEVWIEPIDATPTEELKFTISYTLMNRLRVDYGDILVTDDYVLAQYFYPSGYEYRSQRPRDALAKIVTWFGEESCLFFVRCEAMDFRIVMKGKLSEAEIRSRDDVVVFWKSFWH